MPSLFITATVSFTICVTVNGCVGSMPVRP